MNRIAQTTSEHPGMSVDLFSQRFDIANDDNPVPPHILKFSVFPRVLLFACRLAPSGYVQCFRKL